MREDLVLDGKAPRTVKLYVAAVRGLAKHYRCCPERLTEQQIREYLVYLTEERKLKPNSMRSIVAGIQFFYRVTLPRDWPSLAAVRIPKSRTLPAVLLAEDCWQLIEATRAEHFRTFFRTMFTCGLRPGDARHLRPQDIDSQRMMLHVRTTKGSHDRCVPLPQTTLEALREYWRKHRNPNWLFPARGDLDNIATVDKPIHERSIQRAFAEVVRSVGLKQAQLRPHTLRHSYATTLLEAGVNLRVLQSYLGHKNLQATEVYLHLTRHSDQQAREAIDRLMNRPPQPPETPRPSTGDDPTQA